MATESPDVLAARILESRAKVERDTATLKQWHTAVAPLVGDAAPAPPVVNPASVRVGVGALLAKWYRYVPLFLLACWSFGWSPKDFNPGNHTWYYPQITCVPYVPPGPGPGPTPPVPPPPVVGHLHATVVYDADAATQADAAVRESPTIGASLGSLDCAWRTLDKTNDAAALAKLGLLPIAANVGLPALIVQTDAGKVLAASKLPTTEADTVAVVSKIRKGN